MIKKQINQNDNYNLELLNSVGYDYVFNNNPINNLKNKINIPKISSEDKTKNLEKLKSDEIKILNVGCDEKHINLEKNKIKGIF